MGAIGEHIRKKLETEIRTNGLIVWLDKKNEFSELTDEWIQKRKEGKFNYDIFAFRGSFLELVVQSREVLSGKESPRCVIHMPGFNEQEIKTTPLCEAYKAGKCWRISLETMVREAAQGRLTENQTSYLLESAPLILSVAEEYISNEQNIPQEILRLLNKYGEDGFIIEFLSNPAIINEELRVGIAQRFPLLKDYFSRLLGLDDAWIQDWNKHHTDYSHPDDQADLLMSYLMAMEFVDDLKIPPPTPRLQRLKEKQKEFFRKGNSILEQFREKMPQLYIQWAGQIETNLWAVETKLQPKDLGRIDTFRFEADTFVNEALRLLADAQWNEAVELAQTRLPGRKSELLAHTFWLQQDRQRLWLWEWIETAAQLGKLAIDISNELKLLQVKKLAHEQVVKLYINKWWELDKIHRMFSLFSERYQSANTATHFELFVTIRKNVRTLYRQCIDEQSVLWNHLCELSGFLPPASLQQRNFFANWVKPRLEKKKKTALFFIDALRYELGKELLDTIKGISKQDQIEPMIAELPTITAVGMNVLVPVVEGANLTPVYDVENGTITGFKGGERQVKNPDERFKALQEHVGVQTAWVTINELLDQNERMFNRTTENQLLVVTALDIDKMGESGALSLGIDYFEKGIGRIKTALQKLKDKGFEEFIITSDHGFIIGDETLEVGRGTRLQIPDRRFAIDTQRNGENLVSVSFSQLNYTVPQTKDCIVFERSSHLLTRQSGTTFYHGGNSLQERLIPVILLSSTRQSTGTVGRFDLTIAPLPPALGFHRVTVTPRAIGEMQLFAAQYVEICISSMPRTGIEIGEVIGGKVTGDLLKLPVDKPSEIYFKFKGTIQKAQLQFISNQAGIEIAQLENAVFYDVDTSNLNAPQENQKVKAEKTPAGSKFSDEIPEEYHAALHHLQKHKALSEKYLVNSLGGERIGARKARSFANKIAEWSKYLPFNIVIEQTGEGKEYRIT
jgi:hypothetical protein